MFSRITELMIISLNLNHAQPESIKGHIFVVAELSNNAVPILVVFIAIFSARQHLIIFYG